MFLVEDMIDLDVPLFPIGGFTGCEKILAAVPVANPAMAGDIQAVTDIPVIDRRHVLEQSVHVTCRVFSSTEWISCGTRDKGSDVGTIRIRSRQVGRKLAKNAGISYGTEISSRIACRVDPGRRLKRKLGCRLRPCRRVI